MDLMKKYFKTSNFSVQTKNQRKEILQNERKTKRAIVAFDRRNIDLNMSPFVSPRLVRNFEVKPKQPFIISNNQSKSTTSSNEAVKKRLEKLAQWKEQKALQKQLERDKKKPIFKVSHVDQSLNVNLENVNKTIKGKLVGNLASKTSHSMPLSHRFKPPANVKPVEGFKFTSRIPKSEPNSKSHSHFSMTTRSMARAKGTSDKNTKTLAKETKAVKPSIIKNKPPLKDTKQINNRPPKEQGDTHKTTEKEKKSTLVTVNKTPPKGKITRKNRSSKSTQQLKNAAQKPVTNVISDNICNTPEVGEERKPKVYISPFVTLSRGKKNATQEFKVRRSTNVDLANCTPEVRDVVLTNSQALSPEAGVNFFMSKLNLEIDRITAICQQWEDYLKDPSMPEEATCSINVALGQSRLLMSQKFKQFKSLICEYKEQKGETKVTCMDLHGYWDTMYIQVEDLNKRFDNLDRLKSNDWKEMLPIEKKVRKVKVSKPKTKKQATASSQLLKMMKKIREQTKEPKNGIESDEQELPITPSREQLFKKQQIQSQSANRRSQRLSMVQNSAQKLSNGSPLAIIRVSQAIKMGNGLTPSRSILKTNDVKLTGKKSVGFQLSSPNNLRRKTLFGSETKKKTSRNCKSLSFRHESDKENSP
ncbi:hypothetical protein ABEB36_007396 [Hypothenemus hampei]|uniref:Disks large-associated protein 5 n=1 Tax=Hypothenemus hampei TaxID=57062 RepID=A0ABD1ETU0_HYPHA